MMRQFAASGAFDGEFARGGDGEILRRLAGRGRVGAARDGFRDDQCAGFAVEADLQAGAGGQGEGVGSLVVEIERGFAV